LPGHHTIAVELRAESHVRTSTLADHGLRWQLGWGQGLCFLHPKITAAVLNEGVVLTEAPLIQQNIDPFASRQFPAGVLLLDALFACGQGRQSSCQPEGSQEASARHR